MRDLGDFFNTQPFTDISESELDRLNNFKGLKIETIDLDSWLRWAKFYHESCDSDQYKSSPAEIRNNFLDVNKDLTSAIKKLERINSTSKVLALQSALYSTNDDFVSSFLRQIITDENRTQYLTIDVPTEYEKKGLLELFLLCFQSSISDFVNEIEVSTGLNKNLVYSEGIYHLACIANSAGITVHENIGAKSIFHRLVKIWLKYYMKVDGIKVNDHKACDKTGLIKSSLSNCYFDIKQRNDRLPYQGINLKKVEKDK